MSGRKRTLKLGWRELWPVWVVFGVLIAIGIIGMQMMFPTPTRPKTLLGGEDLKLNLAELGPTKVRLFAYPATPRNQGEFFVERSPGGGVTAAFASCRRCYRSGHYQQAGQHFVRLLQRADGTVERWTNAWRGERLQADPNPFREVRQSVAGPGRRRAGDLRPMVCTGAGQGRTGPN